MVNSIKELQEDIIQNNITLSFDKLDFEIKKFYTDKYKVLFF